MNYAPKSARWVPKHYAVRKDQSRGGHFSSSGLIRQLDEERLYFIGRVGGLLFRPSQMVCVPLTADSGQTALDPENLKDVNKSFSKPAEYAAVLDRLAKRNLYAITKSILSAVPARTIFEEEIQGLVAGTTDRIR